MLNLDNVTTKDDNKSWPYRILKMGPSRSGKTSALLHLIQQNTNIIDKTYLYAEDLEESKYQLLIKKREQRELENLNDHNAFIEYWNSMDDVYNNIDDYNPKKRGKF